MLFIFEFILGLIIPVFWIGICLGGIPVLTIAILKACNYNISIWKEGEEEECEYTCDSLGADSVRHCSRLNAFDFLHKVERDRINALESSISVRISYLEGRLISEIRRVCENIEENTKGLDTFINTQRDLRITQDEQFQTVREMIFDREKSVEELRELINVEKVQCKPKFNVVIKPKGKGE